MSTQRTKAALDALFVDNTTRAITPAMLRDFVESCLPSHGAIHFADPAVITAIATVSTWTKAANASALHSGAYRFSQPANNRLQYDGVTSVNTTVTAALSFTASANNKTLAFAIGVNGTPDEDSKVRTRIGTGSDVQAVTIIAHPTLTPGDYLELFVMNETDSTDLTVEHCHMTAHAFLT